MKKINDGFTPQQRYDRTHTKSIHLKLNCELDKDIIKYLDLSGNIQGTIKTLVRKAIAQEERE